MSELTIQNERMLHIVIACSQEQERRDIEDRLAAQTRRLLLKDARDWSELKDLLGGESVDVVLIGTNNLGAGQSVMSAADGIRETVATLRAPGAEARAGGVAGCL